MDNPQGEVIAFVPESPGRRAIVDVDVEVACPRCAVGKGCGAGLLTGAENTRRIEASVPSGMQLSEGDLVEIALKSDNLLVAAAIVYGLPMLGAVVAAGLAYYLSLGDGGAAVAAVIGLVAGAGIGRLRLNGDDCLKRFIPVINKRIRSTPKPS